MKRRAVAAICILLMLLLLIVILAETVPHLLTYQSIQLNSKLFYMLALAAGIGAFLMFLFAIVAPAFRPDIKIPVRFSFIRTSSEIHEAEIALQLGDLEAASSLLAKIGQGHSDYAYSLKLIGDVACKAGDLSRSEEMYQMSLRVAIPREQALVYFALGSLFERKNLIDQAEDLYTQCLKLAPDSFDAAFRLREIAISLRDWNTAFNRQQYLEEHFPDRLTTLGEENKKAGIRYEVARMEFERGSYRNAQALLKHIQRSNPVFTPAYLLAGEILERTGDAGNAVKIWAKGFSHTKNEFLLRRISDYFLYRNMPQRAIEFFQQVIPFRGENSVLDFCFAELCLKMDLLNESAKILESLIRRHPEWLWIRKVHADILLRNDQAPQAAGVYRRLLEQSANLQLWSCSNCNHSYPEFQLFCRQCNSWDSVRINLNQAGEAEMKSDESSSPPLREVL